MVWLPQRPRFTTFYLGLSEGDFHLQPTNVNDLNAAAMDRVFLFYDFQSSKGGNSYEDMEMDQTTRKERESGIR